MAKCEACRREMMTACGCTFGYVRTFSGKYVRRFKVGEEGHIQPGERCGDCGALYGNYHHPGCDIERCPICAGQLLSCDCDISHFAINNFEEVEGQQ